VSYNATPHTPSIRPSSVRPPAVPIFPNYQSPPPRLNRFRSIDSCTVTAVHSTRAGPCHSIPRSQASQPLGDIKCPTGVPESMIMARTSSGDRMRAFYPPPTFISATHPLPSIQASAVPLMTHLHIAQSSSSASNPSDLRPTSGTLYGHGSSVPINLSSSQALSYARSLPSNRSSFVADYSSLAATPIPTSSSTPPLLPLSHASVTRPSQTINPSQNAHSGQPKSNSPPPPRREVPCHPLFLLWLHTRREWIIGQGYRDPLLVGPALLAQMFDWWLPRWWPLFHILCIGAPETNPSSWIGIFDFWFVTLSTEHPPSPSLLQTTPPNACAISTDSHQASDLAISSPVSTPSASRSKKHYRNEMSALTVKQIQQACTVAGGDADAVQRLAVVFPPGGVITRGALKVGRMDHRGYQEFSELVNDRWCCQLCNMLGRRTWKNQKDILNHVWNEHCDPPPSR